MSDSTRDKCKLCNTHYTHDGWARAPLYSQKLESASALVPLERRKRLANWNPLPTGHRGSNTGLSETLWYALSGAQVRDHRIGDPCTTTVLAKHFPFYVHNCKILALIEWFQQYLHSVLWQEFYKTAFFYIQILCAKMTYNLIEHIHIPRTLV